MPTERLSELQLLQHLLAHLLQHQVLHRQRVRLPVLLLPLLSLDLLVGGLVVLRWLWGLRRSLLHA